VRSGNITTAPAILAELQKSDEWAAVTISQVRRMNTACKNQEPRLDDEAKAAKRSEDRRLQQQARRHDAKDAALAAEEERRRKLQKLIASVAHHEPKLMRTLVLSSTAQPSMAMQATSNSCSPAMRPTSRGCLAGATRTAAPQRSMWPASSATPTLSSCCSMQVRLWTWHVRTGTHRCSRHAGTARSTLSARVDQIDANSMTPLWTACHQGRVDLAKILLEAKADPTRKVQEWSPLMLAEKDGRKDLSELLRAYLPAGSSSLVSSRINPWCEDTVPNLVFEPILVEDRWWQRLERLGLSAGHLFTLCAETDALSRIGRERRHSV